MFIIKKKIEDRQMAYNKLVMNYKKYLETWITFQISVGDYRNDIL